MNARDKRIAIWLGIGGLLGSLLVGTGEFLMQFTPDGKLDMSYDYFNQVSQKRLTMGHFLCVISGPLYFIGYAHLGYTLDKTRGWLGKIIMGIGIYSFGVGTAWIGGRVYLGLAKQGISTGLSSQELLQSLAEHNEPLIQILRIAILLISILWIYAIVSGRSYYPKWMAAFSPIVLLVGIFVSYMVVPAIGKFLLPTAMNLTHLVIFSLSLYHVTRLSPVSD